jgi:hypothetical protein
MAALSDASRLDLNQAKEVWVATGKYMGEDHQSQGQFALGDQEKHGAIDKRLADRV